MLAAHLKRNVNLQRQTHFHSPFEQQGQQVDILNPLEEHRSPSIAPDLPNANIAVAQYPLVVNKGALCDEDVIPGSQGVGVHEVVQTGVKEALGAPGAVGDSHVVAVAVSLLRFALHGQILLDGDDSHGSALFYAYRQTLRAR